MPLTFVQRDECDMNGSGSPRLIFKKRFAERCDVMRAVNHRPRRNAGDANAFDPLEPAGYEARRTFIY